ncbi:MAG TPA: carboxypeptidase regulatory-like domain-containing protein [Gemmatimonadaceae bacterium]|nr:carboxypeptidase regulatory-like domain-containing protein [Gemmatimonadaceae bacterium]
MILGMTLAAGHLGAQVVRLRITDAASDAPLPNATITAIGERMQWRSDSTGRVVVAVRRPGANIFTIRRLGFDEITTTLEVPERDTLNVHVIMHAAARTLDTVTVNAVPVVARLSDFERRRQQKGGGTFITRAEIENNPPIQTADLLRRVSSVDVRQKGMQTVVVSRRGPVSVLVTPDMCVMPLGRDGLILGPNYNLNDIPANEIYGIEVYPGPADIPVEFRNSLPNGNCGLIMVWTRSSR